jgi:predicted RecA/RadA family phage recombinase
MARGVQIGQKLTLMVQDMQIVENLTVMARGVQTEVDTNDTDVQVGQKLTLIMQDVQIRDFDTKGTGWADRREVDTNGRVSAD